MKGIRGWGFGIRASGSLPLPVRLCLGSIAASLLVASSGCHKGEVPPKPLTPVKAQTVELFTAADELRYSANVEPSTQVNATFKVGGYVDRIHQVRGADGRERAVQEGDFVAAGTVLAQLRQNDYSVKVTQVKSQLAEAQSSMQAAKSQLVEAEAGAQQAQLDFARARNLFESQSITKADFDAASTRVEASRARVETARNQVGAIQSRMAGAQAMLAEAGIVFQDTELKAPLAGVVMKKSIEVGSLVAPGVPAFVLADTRTVKVIFGVPDTLMSKLKAGMVVPVRTEALPKTVFSGHITRIAPAADPRSRVFEVEVGVSNADNLLKTGMIASVTLAGTSGARQRLVVPLTAVVRSKSKSDGYAVFVVSEEGGRPVARLRDVELGEAFGNTIAVAAGLDPGQSVITLGSNLVSDGETVRLIP